MASGGLARLSAVAALFELPEAEVLHALQISADEGCWFLSDTVSGTRVIVVPSPSPERTKLFLSRAPGGSVLPAHLHEARETVLVLRGAFRDDSGSLTLPGESLTSEPGTQHSIFVERGEDCICAIRIDFPGQGRALGAAGIRQL